MTVSCINHAARLAGMRRNHGSKDYERLNPEAEAVVRRNLSKELEFYEHARQRLAAQVGQLRPTLQQLLL